MAYCKVSVRVGLGNEPRDPQTPCLSVNPPRVACLDPVCALMKHVMSAAPPTHKLATSTSPASLASPHPCPSPPASVASHSSRPSSLLTAIQTPRYKLCRCHTVRQPSPPDNTRAPLDTGQVAPCTSCSTPHQLDVPARDIQFFGHVVIYGIIGFVSVRSTLSYFSV